MSAQRTEPAILIVAVLAFSVVQIGHTQEGTGSAAARAGASRVTELYGMEFIRSTSPTSEIWTNTNAWAVTAVWRWGRKSANSDGETSGKTSLVFQAKESREVKFAGDCFGPVIVMAYKDEMDMLLQGDGEKNWKQQEPDWTSLDKSLQ